jgi:hypothetical protein
MDLLPGFSSMHLQSLETLSLSNHGDRARPFVSVHLSRKPALSDWVFRD